MNIKSLRFPFMGNSTLWLCLNGRLLTWRGYPAPGKSWFTKNFSTSAVLRNSTSYLSKQKNHTSHSSYTFDGEYDTGLCATSINMCQPLFITFVPSDFLFWWPNDESPTFKNWDLGTKYHLFPVRAVALNITIYSKAGLASTPYIFLHDTWPKYHEVTQTTIARAHKHPQSESASGSFLAVASQISLSKRRPACSWMPISSNKSLYINKDKVISRLYEGSRKSLSVGSSLRQDPSHKSPKLLVSHRS